MRVAILEGRGAWGGGVKPPDGNNHQLGGQTRALQAGCESWQLSLTPKGPRWPIGQYLDDQWSLDGSVMPSAGHYSSYKKNRTDRRGSRDIDHDREISCILKLVFSLISDEIRSLRKRICDILCLV